MFDVVVIGGGHAGTEAAAAAARRGAHTALLSFDRHGLGAMSCNPAIGGLGKGHIVREVDAFDGLIGRAADEGAIHYRMLNRSKGTAVQGPRVQADRRRYAGAIQAILAAQPKLTIVEGEAGALGLEGGRGAGGQLAEGTNLAGRAGRVGTRAFPAGGRARGGGGVPAGEAALAAGSEGGASITADADAEPASEPEEDEGLKPLSDRLVSELTAYRTVALREALSERPDIAYLAVLHALSLRVFYHYAQDSCPELELKSVSFPAQVPGLTDSKPAQQLRYLHETWEAHLPKEPEALWDTLVGWDEESRQALFAFVVAHRVNASVEAYNRRPRALAHADRIAAAGDLDVAATGWTPTVDTVPGRGTNAPIRPAAAEAKGQRAADRSEHMKKGEMADQAQELLVGTGWIPEPLRTPGRPVVGSVRGV